MELDLGLIVPRGRRPAPDGTLSVPPASRSRRAGGPRPIMAPKAAPGGIPRTEPARWPPEHGSVGQPAGRCNPLQSQELGNGSAAAAGEARRAATEVKPPQPATWVVWNSGPWPSRRKSDMRRNAKTPPTRIATDRRGRNREEAGYEQGRCPGRREQLPGSFTTDSPRLMRDSKKSRGASHFFDSPARRPHPGGGVRRAAHVFGYSTQLVWGRPPVSRPIGARPVTGWLFADSSPIRRRWS